MSDILEMAKSQKNEISRNKSASAKLLDSSAKIHKRIEALHDKSKVKIESTLDAVKKDAAANSLKLKKQMGQDRDTVEQIRKDTKKEYSKFKRAYTAAANTKTGVSAHHDKITKLHENSKLLHSEISKNATSSKNTEAGIRNLRDNAKKNESQIATINTRAITLSKEIEDTYSIVVDATLAGTLVNRRDDLKPTVRIWERVYIASLAMISVAIIVALTVDRPSALSDIVTERLVFITPLVIVAFVASRQFSHERKLLEEYAFKAATAQSLKGYTLLLNEQFKDLPDSRKEILNFTIGAMKNIYDRQPLESKNGKYHFVIGNKLARIEAKIEEMQQELQKEVQAVHKNITD